MLTPFRLVLMLIVSAACSAARGAAEGVIARVLPFATAEQVRVVTELGSSDGDLALSGTIAEWHGGTTLWQGSLQADQTLRGLHPKRWSPGSPALYVLTVTAKRHGETIGEAHVRFGFRTIAVKDGQITLNGRPIFLRGLAINPPGRTIPDSAGMSAQFASDYVRFMRSRHFNLIRMTVPFEPGLGQAWFDACDEQGMLVFQGDYGRPPGAVDERTPARDFGRALAGYKAVFTGFVPHPSIVIYILANELPNPTGSLAPWHAFLTRAWHELHAWDPTRIFIGNAGYGLGGEGDLDDVHRYWGWYYNTFLTYYNLRDPGLFGDPKLDQPITFSECVGSFTGQTGAFNVIEKKQLLAQQQWTGNSSHQVEDALAYQAFMAQQAAESFRRMREINPRLAGLMPFTILFYNWNGVTSFAQMGAKPVADSMGVAYQPVLLSWELWTPQVYPGARLRPVAHVINDAEDYRALQGAVLRYVVKGADGREVLRAEETLPEIPYYGTWHRALELTLPADLPAGDYRVEGEVVAGGKTVSQNRIPFFVGKRPAPVPASVRLRVYDPSGRTLAALGKLGVTVEAIADLRALNGSTAPVVIGQEAWDAAATAGEDGLKEFIRGGGRVLCLGQRFDRFDAGWLPAPVRMLTTSANDSSYLKRSRPTFDQMAINPERPDHPALAGLSRARLRLWSDYTAWDQSRSGFPRVYPVTYGFTLTKAEAVADTAIIADYDRGLEGIGLCEMFSGKGSVVLCAFDLAERVGIDPSADRMLANLAAYAVADGHERHALVTEPIRWGDYPSQQGVVSGSLQGFYNGTRWLRPPTNPKAKPQREGSWNMMPGDQMVPYGVRPRGPYAFGTSSTAVDLHPEEKIGTGFFWARLPAGRTEVVSAVENPTRTAAPIEVRVNGREGPRRMLQPGEQATLTAPITGDARDVKVEYRGGRDVLIVETDFR